jgi:hypothetical protein
MQALTKAAHEWAIYLSLQCIVSILWAMIIFLYGYVKCSILYKWTAHGDAILFHNRNLNIEISDYKEVILNLQGYPVLSKKDAVP